jgi:hypothetical protein
MEAEFLDMMPHLITFEPNVGTNLYSKPSYGSPQTVRGRVVYGAQKTTNEGGQEVVARGKVTVGATLGLTPKYRMTLPDGTQPVIINVDRYPDEYGAHHEVVFFG